jgi:hypothetical protein
MIDAPRLEPTLTLEGLRELVADLRRAGEIPQAILVSEYDRRELNQEVLAASKHPVAKEDQRPQHDGDCVAIIEGVPILGHVDVARGKARLVYYDKTTLH